MTYADVLAFIRENPICTIATMDDGGQPRARGFATVLFDDGALYFTTGATKKVYKQISVNPKVELCYMTADFGTMLRVTGNMEVVGDRRKKQRLIAERDYLKGLSAGDPAFVLLRLAHGSARFWKMSDNLREDSIKPIEF